ncbi:PQQ-binding-like beta-propeller repeat protein [Chloroflexia bacterium SDU3-3]|nr:PQQ-binding-like beta-propeller repeat protein [Chloroflexia bacterium SDU3-3]
MRWSPPPLGSGAYLYVPSSYGISCLNRSTGEELWVYPTRGEIRTALAAADGYLVFGCHDGYYRYAPCAECAAAAKGFSGGDPAGERFCTAHHQDRRRPADQGWPGGGSDAYFRGDGAALGELRVLCVPRRREAADRHRI